MNYNDIYSITKNMFGNNPEKLLLDYHHLLDKKHPVLDIGIGQGRNSFYLAENGFSVIGIDPSKTGIEFVSEIAKKNEYPILTKDLSFEEYETGNTKFSAILVFGLIQILSWKKIELLIKKIDNWLKPGGYLFITGFTILDLSYEKYKNSWERIGNNSFSNDLGEVRTFLEPAQIKSLFGEYKTIHHWEGHGPEHRHGDGPLEKHHMVESVLTKP